MFPLQPGDELVFGTPTTFQGDQIQGDLIVDDYSFLKTKIISFSTSSDDKQLGKTSNFRLGKRQLQSRDDYDIRKVMHRDVERKRRQEMSDLFVSLRSCLPLKHSKGKSSVCDDIQIAVDHIKQMQKNIQELRIRRDKLQKLSTSSHTKVEISPNGGDNFPACVSVQQMLDGVEILISARNIKSSQFGLSRMLAELQEGELDVISCVSTRTNGGFLHKIQIKNWEVSRMERIQASTRGVGVSPHRAPDITSLEVWMLQDRLTNISIK